MSEKQRVHPSLRKKHSPLMKDSSFTYMTSDVDGFFDVAPSVSYCYHSTQTFPVSPVYPQANVNLVEDCSFPSRYLRDGQSYSRVSLWESFLQGLVPCMAIIEKDRHLLYKIALKLQVLPQNTSFLERASSSVYCNKKVTKSKSRTKQCPVITKHPKSDLIHVL